MASRRNIRHADPLAAMPEHLRLRNSPEFCACECCRPEMTAEERAAARGGMEEWAKARAEWARGHGVTALELMRLERPRLAPSKRRGA